MRLILLSALLALAAPALAIPPITPPPPPAPPPALTLVIAVDGLSSGLFDRFRTQFMGGLARVAGGARFDLAPGGGSLLGGPPSLAAVMKQGRPGSRVLVVAGSAPSAAALTDAAADQAWLFANDRFTLQGTAPAPAPAIAAQANAAIAGAIAAAEPALESPPGCAAPPLSSGGRRFARAAGDGAAYRASPQMDGGTLAFALAVARDLDIGTTSARADAIAIGLGATAEIAAKFGAASEETCLGLLALDRDLGDAFAYLDRSGIDYAVVLAGVSAETSPLLWWRKNWSRPATGGPARRVDIVPTIAAMNGVIAEPTPGPGTCLTGMPGIICPPKR